MTNLDIFIEFIGMYVLNSVKLIEKYSYQTN